MLIEYVKNLRWTDPSHVSIQCDLKKHGLEEIQTIISRSSLDPSIHKIFNDVDNGITAIDQTELYTRDEWEIKQLGSILRVTVKIGDEVQLSDNNNGQQPVATGVTTI